MFTAGIHYFDLNKVKNFEEINRIVGMQQTIQSEPASPQFKKIGQLKKGNSEYSQNTSQGRLSAKAAAMAQSGQHKTPKNRVQLLVLDNCDQFLAKDKFSFIGNIDSLSNASNNLGIVLISESRIVHKQIFSDGILFEPFQQPSICKLFLKCMQQNQQLQLDSIVLEKLIKRSKGNVQFLSILSCILKYGGTSILSKIEVKRYSEMDPSFLSLDNKSNNDDDLFDKLTQKDSLMNLNGSIQSKNRLNLAMMSGRWRNQKLDEYQLMSTFQKKKRALNSIQNQRRQTVQNINTFDSKLQDFIDNIPMEYGVESFGSQESESEAAQDKKDNQQNLYDTIKQSEKFNIETSNDEGSELVMNQTIGPSMLNTVRPSQMKKAKIADMNMTVMNKKKKKEVLVTVAEEDENISNLDQRKSKKLGGSSDPYELSQSISVSKPAQSINQYRGFHISVTGQDKEPYFMILDTDKRFINILYQKKNQDARGKDKQMGKTLQVKKHLESGSAQKKQVYHSQRIKKTQELDKYRYEALSMKQKSNIKEIVIYLPHNFDGPHVNSDKDEGSFQEHEQRKEVKFQDSFLPKSNAQQTNKPQGKNAEIADKNQEQLMQTFGTSGESKRDKKNGKNSLLANLDQLAEQKSGQFGSFIPEASNLKKQMAKYPSEMQEPQPKDVKPLSRFQSSKPNIGQNKKLEAVQKNVSVAEFPEFNWDAPSDDSDDIEQQIKKAPPPTNIAKDNEEAKTKVEEKKTKVEEEKILKEPKLVKKVEIAPEVSEEEDDSEDDCEPLDFNDL